MDMSDDGMDMDMSMSMSFSFTCDVGELLFGWWTINSCLSLYLSCIPVIILSCLRHWAYYVATTPGSTAKGVSSGTTVLLETSGFETSSGGRVSQPIPRWPRFVSTMVSTTGAALSLLSMLVVMTYNSGLFIAVLVGEAIGFWVWGNHALPGAMRGCH